MVKCAISDMPYTIFGYNGKQVRDNIHSKDLVSAFYEFYLNPKCGEVYNIGGGRESNCSILEAIEIIERYSGKILNYQCSDVARTGDHQWWISDLSKFKKDFPNWKMQYNINDIIKEIVLFEIDLLNKKNKTHNK